ncbi:hypothetical protein ACQP10_38110 (plasmid) [Streptosporangium sandarakinum]|uniref:hypothetical protein n=1 Tax=Streptosporangium sandarakinum TaxID=1260955 RepID=UPI003D936009
MSKLRKRQSRFVQIPSSTIRDKRLSFRARGILAYLLDMPDDWDVRSEVIAADGKEGREAVRTALRELGVQGYYRLERRQLRDGTWEMGTAVSEEPVPDWAAQWAEAGGGAVTVIEQKDGTFKVQRKDGRLTGDGFDKPAPPTPATIDDIDDESAGDTEDRFPGPGFPGAGFPDVGSPDSGFPGVFNKTETHDRDTKGFPPAVGGVQHRKEPDAAAVPAGRANLRRGPATTGQEPASGENPHRPDAPAGSPALTVCQMLPEPVRTRISTNASGKVLTVAQRELRNRSIAELCERIERRWEGWQRLNPHGRITDGVALAITLLQSRQCANVRCEDGVGLDDGEPCTACAARPRTPRASAVDGGGSPPAPAPAAAPSVPRPRADSQTVAEALSAPADVPDAPRPAPKPAQKPPVARSAETEDLLARFRRPAPTERLKAAQAALTIICPIGRCAAPVGEPCRTEDGEAIPLQRTHSTRIQQARNPQRGETAAEDLVAQVLSDAAATTSS